MVVVVSKKVKKRYESNSKLLINEYLHHLSSADTLLCKMKCLLYLFILVSSDSDELGLDKRVSAKAVVGHLEEVAGAN